MRKQEHASEPPVPFGCAFVLLVHVQIDTVGDAFIVVGGLRGTVDVPAQTGSPTTWVLEPRRSVAPSHPSAADHPVHLPVQPTPPFHANNRQAPDVSAVLANSSCGVNPGLGSCNASLTDADIDWANPPGPRCRRSLDDTGAIALFALDMLAELEQVSVGARSRRGRLSQCGHFNAPPDTLQLSAAYAGLLPAPLQMRIGIHVGDVAGGIVGWARPRCVCQLS